MITTLEQRIRRLEDIEEIRQLRMRYHININDLHFDKMWELFTENAYVDFGYISRATGHAEINELFLRTPRNLPFVKQFIHNHFVEINGDEATGISYLDARYAQAGDSVMVAAKFDEIYVRTAQGWRIKQMLLELYFSVPITVGWAGERMNHVKPFT